MGAKMQEKFTVITAMCKQRRSFSIYLIGFVDKTEIFPEFSLTGRPI